jgi:hypothetical protein
MMRCVGLTANALQADTGSTGRTSQGGGKAEHLRKMNTTLEGSEVIDEKQSNRALQARIQRIMTMLRQTDSRRRP